MKYADAELDGKTVSLVIEPTGTCFEDTMELIFHEMERDKSIIFKEDWKIVHGICKMKDGTEYAHCWAEHEKMVWFSGIFNGEKGYGCTTLKEFYKEYRVKETKKYSILQAKQEELRTGHAQPWEDKFIKLCKGKKHYFKRDELLGISKPQFPTLEEPY